MERKPYAHLGASVVNVWTGDVGTISSAVAKGRSGWDIDVTFVDGHKIADWCPAELWRHHLPVPEGWSLAGKLPSDKVRHLALRRLALDSNYYPRPGVWVCAFERYDVGLSHLYRNAEQRFHAFSDEITVKYEGSRGGLVLSPCLLGKRIDKDFVASTVSGCCELYEDWIQTLVD